VVLVTPASATRGLCETDPTVTFPINENHSDMVKFRQGDSNCRVVLGKLEDICAAQDDPDDRPRKRQRLNFTLGISGQSVSGKESSLSTEQRRLLLDSLRFDQIDARHMTISNALARTCKWLLAHPKYLDWLDPSKFREHHGFLWLKGKPGAGKSTLMKFALANARKTMKDTAVKIISFFFNARGDNLEKSTVGMYRSLVLQLLERLPGLQDVFDSLGLTTWNGGSYQWTIESLQALFIEAVQRLGTSSIVCFIDALDECEEQQIRAMISFFEHVGDLATSISTRSTRFQVFFSSRHYPHITIAKGLSMTLEDQDGHSQDITRYLDSELKIGHSNLAEEIRTDMRNKASGVFMWVVLVTDILNEEYDHGRTHALRQRLQAIPGDLNELFRDILMRDHHRRTELLLCIQWILFAREPLKPEQLYFAILSGAQSDEVPCAWNPDETTIYTIERFILSSSKGLAEITKSRFPKVQFIHESVKDFFLKENGLRKVWPDIGENFRGKCHEKLKVCCLQHMKVAGPSLSLDSLSEASVDEAMERQSAEKRMPFLKYAVQNALYHADLAASDRVDQTRFFQTFIPTLPDWVKLNNFFERRKVRRHKSGVSLLYILAENNMADLISHCPSNKACFEAESSRYGAPILAALSTNSDKAVSSLLAIQANTQPSTSLRDLYDKNFQNGYKGPYLGRTFHFKPSRSVLSYLAENGCELVAAFLLACNESTVDARDKKSRTPLFWAASRGHEAVVQLLLDRGAAVDIPNMDDETPLWRATCNRDEAMARLLLDRGAMVNMTSKDGATPLWRAVCNEDEAIAQLLLDRGAATDIPDKDGETPLWRAAHNGNEAVVRLLLVQGAATDIPDKHGETPLWCAAHNGHEAVVRLLLVQGAATDIPDKHGETPLWCAAHNGHEAVVRLLLVQGAAVNIPNKNGQTPLWYAACNGHEAVVRLLLDQGADVDIPDKDGQTPLWCAARKGHKAVARLLRSHGV
jgi:ankyrin repeat protein